MRVRVSQALIGVYIPTPSPPPLLVTASTSVLFLPMPRLLTLFLYSLPLHTHYSLRLQEKKAQKRRKSEMSFIRKLVKPEEDLIKHAKSRSLVESTTEKVHELEDRLNSVETELEKRNVAYSELQEQHDKEAHEADRVVRLLVISDPGEDLDDEMATIMMRYLQDLDLIEGTPPPPPPPPSHSPPTHTFCPTFPPLLLLEYGRVYSALGPRNRFKRPSLCILLRVLLLLLTPNHVSLPHPPPLIPPRALSFSSRDRVQPQTIVRPGETHARHTRFAAHALRAGGNRHGRWIAPTLRHLHGIFATVHSGKALEPRSHAPGGAAPFARTVRARIRQIVDAAVYLVDERRRAFFAR